MIITPKHILKPLQYSNFDNVESKSQSTGSYSNNSSSQASSNADKLKNPKFNGIQCQNQAS